MLFSPTTSEPLARPRSGASCGPRRPSRPVGREQQGRRIPYRGRGRAAPPACPAARSTRRTPAPCPHRHLPAICCCSPTGRRAGVVGAPQPLPAGRVGSGVWRPWPRARSLRLRLRRRRRARVDPSRRCARIQCRHQNKAESAGAQRRRLAAAALAAASQPTGRESACMHADSLPPTPSYPPAAPVHSVSDSCDCCCCCLSLTLTPSPPPLPSPSLPSGEQLIQTASPACAPPWRRT